MAKDCIIYLPEVGQDLVQWATSDGGGKLLSAAQTGTMAEAASAISGLKSILVLPGDNVLLAEATVPGNASRAQQAIPFALEEQVADDIESLHFALGKRDSENNYPVAVINRDTMELLREQMDEAGLRPVEVVPEILALPKFDPATAGPVWSALVDDNHTVVRLNGYRGFATDSETAEIMLSGAKHEYEEEFSRGIVLFHTEPELAEPVIDDLDIETRYCDSRLGLYATGLAASPRINLLQGDYGYSQQMDIAWKPWAWTAVLATVLGALFLAGTAFDYMRLGREEAAVNEQITKVFQETFPGVRARRPVAQMKSRLKQLGGGVQSSGFTSDLAIIAAAFKAQPQSSINSIGYRPGRFDLDVSTDALPTLDKLKTDIEKAGTLTMKVQSARRQKDEVRSTIRLEAAQ